MEYHIIAFFSGFLLDLMFGDPYLLPHPIRLIGSLIAKVEKCFLEKKKKRDEKKELRQGVYMVIIVLLRYGDSNHIDSVPCLLHKLLSWNRSRNDYDISDFSNQMSEG